MRRSSIYIDRRQPLDVKMTPMIDVVFLLLIFFVWTASFQIAEMLLPSQLSAQMGSQPEEMPEVPPPELDFDQVVIKMGWDGTSPTWQINETPFGSLQLVRDQLGRIAAIKLDTPVILHPAKEVPLGHVIDVYDVARLVGFEEIQFATTEEI